MPLESSAMPQGQEDTGSVIACDAYSRTYYPICLAVAGKRCIVLGGGKVAERKVISLLEAGAHVVVISPDLTPRLSGLHGEGRVEYEARIYQPGDLEQALLAIAATDDHAANLAVVEEAGRRNVLVNVADEPSGGNFILPALHRRGDLLITASTSGRSPALARYIRDELETLLTPEHVTLLEILVSVRAELSERGQKVPGETWRLALDGELLALIGHGHHELARKRLLARLSGQREGGHDLSAAGVQAAASVSSAKCALGKVFLVGAGPGDPGLITVRGIELLRQAEVVIYDHLIDTRLLDEAPSRAELIYVGKLASRHTLRQPEINALLVAKAREGKQVVRLKGGDPFVFGRGGEEAQELAAAGIPFEIVPGVTSVVAVPAYAGIPVTHRAHASSFAVVTGHEDPSKPSSKLDWGKLATGVDTLVCLMGAQNLSHIVSQLQLHGRSPETPIALIRWGTWQKQETLVGTLADIVELATVRRFASPTIAIVGDVVRLRDTISWFDESCQPD